MIAMKSLTTWLLLLACAALVACSQPLDTPVPKEIEKLESIKPALDKLSPQERELFAGYVMRHTVGAKLGALFGGKDAGGIPDGMTIGRAIEEQRKFKADFELAEARERALKEKLKAERDLAVAKMRDVVTVTLVSKELKPERGYGGRIMDEHLVVTFGYKNNGEKDIAGVKGKISIRDLFGDEVTGFQVSNDETLRAGATSTWTGSRSVMYAAGRHGNDRKFAELADDKFKLQWEPQVIVFNDGSQLTVPK